MRAAAQIQTTDSRTVQRAAQSRIGDVSDPIRPSQHFGEVSIYRKASCPCGGNCPACQAKSSNLKVSHPNDPAEIEADQIAEQVMRMPVNQTSTAPVQPKPLSIASTPAAQAKGGEGGAVNSELSDKITSSLGNGGSLDGETLSFMQQRFGTDFSGIKVHPDAEAVQMSRDLTARAFTVGKDIYFNEGQYDPHTESGKRLLVHELTHTLQQKGNSSLQPTMIQRDLAVEPTAPEAVGRELTESQMRSALRWNQAAFTDADEIALLRGVLGISADPSVIDEDFIRALVQYQANYGLTQDGLLGAGTARRLADELRAEGDYLGADADVGSATEMAINPAERRMRLRSRVVGRLGRLLHQGFIGSRENPTGIVTVRSGFSHSTTGTRTNLIGINYTGADVANSRWLQFTFSQMSAIDPTTRRRVYRGGSVTTSGGAYNYSNATTFNWNVDTVPATGSMYYEAGGASERVAGAHTEIFDQPAGWNTEAEAFAATSFASRPSSVRLIKGFDTYLVVNNNSVVYHVRWNLYFNFNTSVTPTPDVAGTYEVLAAGPVTRLPSDRNTRLNTQFPGNTVP